MSSAITSRRICSESTAKSRLQIELVVRLGVVRKLDLDDPKAQVEVTRLDRADKGVDHRRDRRRLARRDRARQASR